MVRLEWYSAQSAEQGVTGGLGPFKNDPVQNLVSSGQLVSVCETFLGTLANVNIQDIAMEFSNARWVGKAGHPPFSRKTRLWEG